MNRVSRHILGHLTMSSHDRDMRVSIVIPIFNAAYFVEDSIQAIKRVLEPLGLDHEILLRDDGSVDGSKEILERLARQNSQVRCFYNQSNEGLGTTLTRLFNDARGKQIVYCDCDLPFGAKIIPVLLGELQKYDIAVASRYGGVSNHVLIIRRIFSRMYYLLCKLLFNIPVVDLGSGSVAISRGALKRLDFTMKRFGIHAEIYSKASKRGLIITEIPAQSYQGKQGCFSIFRHGPNALIETLQYWLQTLKITN